MIAALSHERSRMRTMIMTRRDLLPLAERLAQSERIAASLLAHPVFRQKKILFIYCHFRSEVQTTLVIEDSLRQGKTVCTPMSMPDEMDMVAVLITDPVHDLAPGYKGILEPLPLLAQTRKMEPSAIEVAVIPGTVFDLNGHRLGYGMGFYDRFLVHAPGAIRIGLAFSCQMVERLPIQQHDIPMDMIITEEGVMAWPQRLHAPDRG
ncbi:MAG: 5-formyltetrahydrofolate cyclo-ligase [Desulfobulbus sp.]|nr:5-formyltetrahydrofolate cyclo-ligase [Desulfobulbus sp.]